MTADNRLLIPEGWAPRPGARVRILPNPKAAPDEPPPPAGVWWVIDRAPGATEWWVLPHDDTARAWSSARPPHPTFGRALALGYRRLTPASTAMRS